MQKIVVAVAVLLFAIKLIAWFLTRSVSILTDALESTANVAAGFIGLFSLYIAARPRDHNHPYGHGKAEFLSAGVEGSLIILAGLLIIYKSVYSIIYPHIIQRLDHGIILIASTAIINYIVGYISISKGKKNNSLALVSSGEHLQTDTYSTIGIVAGLILIYFTKIYWLDSVVALIFAMVIIVTGYKIMRRSIAGIMDEADSDLLKKLVNILNLNRQNNWIDLHNLRVIKYGGQLHIDCHLTVPWYINIRDAHVEVEQLGILIKRNFGDAVEFFVHSDGCLLTQCNICNKHDCPVRQKPFEQRIEWTTDNLLTDRKHSLERDTKIQVH